MPADTARAEAVLGPIDEDVNLLQQLLRQLQTAGQPGQPSRDELLRRMAAQLDEVPARIQALQGLQQEYSDLARELERVRNLLSHLEREFRRWLPQPGDAAALVRLCHEVLEEVRLLWIPWTVNERDLYPLRVGTPFDFLQEYEQELSTELERDLRPRVLQRLKRDRTLWGWVDEEGGIIYRAATGTRRKLASLVLVFGLPLLGLLAYVFLAPALQPPGAGWQWWAIAGNYLIFFSGYVVHVVKKAMEGTKDPLLSDIFVWIHVRETPLAWLGVSIWVVWAGMGLFGLFPDLGLFRQITTTTAITSFTAGVSVDSLAATALKHYQRKVSVQAQVLQGMAAGGSAAKSGGA
jgi:hypothetical protein